MVFWRRFVDPRSGRCDLSHLSMGPLHSRISAAGLLPPQRGSARPWGGSRSFASKPPLSGIWGGEVSIRYSIPPNLGPYGTEIWSYRVFAGSLGVLSQITALSFKSRSLCMDVNNEPVLKAPSAIKSRSRTNLGPWIWSGSHISVLGVKSRSFCMDVKNGPALKAPPGTPCVCLH